MAGNDKWLQNASFDASLLTNKEQSSRDASAALRTNLLAQAATSSEDEAQETTKRKRDTEAHKEKKRHKKERNALRREERLAELDARARAVGLRAPKPQLYFNWAEQALGSLNTYCIDSHREPDNIVYEKPYLAHIPAYRRVLPTGNKNLKALLDDSLQNNPRRSKRQRFTTKRAKWREDNKAVPRLQLGRDTAGAQNADTILQPSRMNLPQPNFIPISPPEGYGGQERNLMQSEEERMRQRTIDFNKATTERPEDLQSWLDFAAFQRQVFGLDAAPREKRARLERDAAEKVVDILQKALKHHPQSDTILLELMRATTVFLDGAATLKRWQEVLGDPAYSRSWRLWRAFIAWLKCEHLGQMTTEITATFIRNTYDQALKAAAKERLRLLREQLAKEAREAEEALVDVLVAACQFDLQSGHIELGISRIQAALEFTLLSPAWSTAVPGPGGDSVRKPLFEQYWASGAPLIGEVDGLGWQQWAIGQQAQRVETPPLEEPEDEESGGWTGWQDIEVGVAKEATTTVEGNTEVGGSDEDEDAVHEEEDEEALELERYSKLLDMEAAQLRAGQSATPEVIMEWLRWERYRERCQWQPLRPGQENRQSGANNADSENDDRVGFEDIEAGLFALGDSESRRRLALQLLSLLDAPLGQWESSNSRSLPLIVNTTASVPPMTADWLLRQPDWHDGQGMEAVADGKVAWLSPDWTAAGQDAPILKEQGTLTWYQADEGRRCFLFRILSTLLRRSHLSEDVILCRAALAVASASCLHHQDPAGSDSSELPEAVFEDRGASQPMVRVVRQDAAAVRASASNLLKEQSQNSALWTAYAEFEALHGSIKRARKTFNLHLQNASKAGDRGSEAAPLALAFASMELKRKASNYQAMAANILAWLAIGEPSFQPLDDKACSMPSEHRMAEARQGFQSHLSRIVSQAGRPISPHQGAMLSAAALFLQLGEDPQGTAAAARLLKNVLADFALEVRRDSLVLEELTVQQCRLLSAASVKNGSTPKEARSSLNAALQVYPRNIALMQLLVTLEQHAYMTSQLRLKVRMVCQEHAFVPLWMLAAKLEASQLLSGHRMKQVFKQSEKQEQLDQSPLWQRIILAFSAFSQADNLDVIFARVSSRCPWVKEMWLDGLRYLGDQGFRLLEAEKRDIRTRTSLDEVVYALAGKRLEENL